jgi:hypothetical protein
MQYGTSRSRVLRFAPARLSLMIRKSSPATCVHWGLPAHSPIALEAAQPLTNMEALVLDYVPPHLIVRSDVEEHLVAHQYARPAAIQPHLERSRRHKTSRPHDQFGPARLVVP